MGEGLRLRLGSPPKIGGGRPPPKTGGGPCTQRTPVGQDPPSEAPGRRSLNDGLRRILLSGSRRKGRRPSTLAEAPDSGFGSGSA